MLNIAHRGFKGAFPENTMLAFKKAIEAGCDAIEFDIHLSKDNELVIIHDEKLDRTTDLKGFVKDFTLEELKKADASKLYENIEKEEIPTLRQYFDFIKDKDIITNIELKTSIITYDGIEDELHRLIKEYDIKDKLIISSFNHNSLVRMKDLDSDIKCGVLESSRLYRPWEYVKSLGMEYFHPLNFTVNKKVIDKFREDGIGVNVWFGISDYDFKEVYDMNPAGLITDYPDRIAKFK